MTNEEARLQLALRDVERDCDNQRRRAEEAESRHRDAVKREQVAVNEAAGLREVVEGRDELLAEIADMLPERASPEPREHREILADLKAELDRLRAIEAVRVDAIGSILVKHAAAVGAVGPMPARAIEASFVAVHSHRVGDASPETAAPCGEPDASLEARADRSEAARAAFEKSNGYAPGTIGAWNAVVRAVDASRPTLTEEQAREIAADVATSFNARWSIGLGQGPLKDMADRIEAGVLRASRGETGPAADPRTTLHAGDPASLAEVVAASAREPHADVVLHALHVSGGAAAVASLDEKHVLVTSRVDGVTRTTVDGEHVPLRRAAGPKCNNCDDTGTCGACNAEPVDPPCVLCSLGDCLCGERRGNREP